MKKTLILLLAAVLLLGCCVSGASAAEPILTLLDTPTLLGGSFWIENSLPMVNVIYYDPAGLTWIACPSRLPSFTKVP